MGSDEYRSAEQAAARLHARVALRTARCRRAAEGHTEGRAEGRADDHMRTVVGAGAAEAGARTVERTGRQDRTPAVVRGWGGRRAGRTRAGPLARRTGHIERDSCGSGEFGDAFGVNGVLVGRGDLVREIARQQSEKVKGDTHCTCATK